MKPLKYYFHKLKKKEDSGLVVKTKSIMESFLFLLEKIKENKRLFFIRFGDGEFVTMLKQDHRNYRYNENLAKEIEESFRIEDENYLISCPINYPYDEFHADGIYKRFKWQEEMIQLMKEKNFPEKTFENPCVFQCLTVFKPKLVKQFLDQHIRNKTKMFIGSTKKDVAEKLYGKINYYVQIPAKNAYETIDSWWKEIEKNCQDVELIIPSAGSASNAIALRLWKKNVTCNLIDFGSIIDAVDRKKTRTWIRLQGHKAFKLLDEKPKFSTKEKLTILRKEIKFYFRNQIF